MNDMLQPTEPNARKRVKNSGSYDNLLNKGSSVDVLCLQDQPTTTPDTTAN